jgi:hypothetical protein
VRGLVGAHTQAGQVIGIGPLCACGYVKGSGLPGCTTGVDTGVVSRWSKSR